MTALPNRAFRLRHRPEDPAGRAPLELVEEDLAPLADGQALVRTLVLSVDPVSRVFMSDIRSDLPPVGIGEVMRGVGIGRVVDSRRADLPVGAHVLGWTGWQDYQVADDAVLEGPFAVLPDPLPAAPEDLLGVLGMTGITAWLAVEIADPRPGDTVVVSAAGGAVGSIAGQLVKERGARVVGIAGGREKCRYVVEELGFDACVDRRSPDWRDQFDAATPDGVDADVENAGGEVLDHLLTRINTGARIALCGMIADYSADPAQRHGLRNVVEVLEQRATIRGFLVSDHADRYDGITAELAARLADGRLTHARVVVDGLERAPEALERIFRGDNRGKVVVRVAPDSR
ncbi:NADPH2:quinone reductase [Saccharothrix coeruleofusca]|uniref:NADP-dependent oxidoreductase n=1 Tax=Saccharothrix coeruleofusca TaxID=33919 RepID=UPI001AE32998|nr:NADP-dependent oxidoreductase [Saccharothrix coeruleofusca]MBP2334186.1 NADPH2:quinone reductase [Saccharothrix coeruleofusca]